MIEQTRRDMFNICEIAGPTSPLTVQISQKLDNLLNLYQQKYGKDPFDIHSMKNLKVDGSIVNNIIQGSLLYDSSLAKTLNEFELHKMNPNKWYPIHRIEEIFSYFEEHYNDELFSYIGQWVPVNCQFPDNIDTFEKSLLNLNVAYHLNHSHASAGYYEVFKDGPNEYTVICNTPFYPYAFNYGIIKGLALKYNIEAQTTIVSYIKGGEFKVVVTN